MGTIPCFAGTGPYPYRSISYQKLNNIRLRKGVNPSHTKFILIIAGFFLFILVPEKFLVTIEADLGFKVRPVE